MEHKLNTKSSRAFKAHYQQILGGRFYQKAIILIGVVLFPFGLFLILKSSPLGYGFVSISLLSFMLRCWYEGELKDLRPNGKDIDGLLDPQILAGLTSNSPSANDVWQATKKTEASFFFQARFMIPHVVFDQYLSKEPGSSAYVWENAFKLLTKYNRRGMSSALIMTALIESIPNIEQLLRQNGLSIEEIRHGINWLAHIEEKRELANKRSYFGGIARDWTFGYTPLLRHFGLNISQQIQTYGFFTDTKRHLNVVDQMIQGMSTGNSTVTLVGDIGVGKTTCVYAFAEKLIQEKELSKKIKYSQVIELDAPSIISQIKSRGELESIMLRILSEAHGAKNIILFFDNASVFFASGQNSVNLTNILLPVLESGSVRLIFAMTPKEWQTLSSDNPSVASQLQSIRMQPANEDETIEVLRDQAIFLEYERKVIFTYQSLREAFRLGGRYVDGQVMPGAALSVLKSASALAVNGLVTDQTIKQSIESSVGVKLANATGDESQKLLRLENELSKYVISQKRAVKVIADALRRSRSGVGNQNKPVGTFLFLGPTGVGKTELAKALARVYFGSEDSIIRVDMNQYLEPNDAKRLITPLLGGDQLGFLGQVKKAPFSVILLDEIEKAHPSVVNLLLQMLDEGVMRDSENKEVSFKDSIIIATSNAGAEEIRKIIDAGKDIAKEDQNFTKYLIDNKYFAPEFLNRFDETVIFSPLTPEELLQVIDLMIVGVNKTLDDKKVNVALSQDAKKWLVEKGYDAKLGARPMRRVVQRYVENIVAKKLLDKSMTSGSQIQLDVKDFENIDA